MIELILKCPKCGKQRRWRKERADDVSQLDKSKFWCFPCGKIFPVKNNIVRVAKLLKYGRECRLNGR